MFVLNTAIGWINTNTSLLSLSNIEDTIFAWMGCILAPRQISVKFRLNIEMGPILNWKNLHENCIFS